MRNREEILEVATLIAGPLGAGKEVRERAATLLRRFARQGVVNAGDVRIDTHNRLVEYAGSIIHFTPREWDVFEPIALADGPVSKESLLKAVNGELMNAVEVYVSRVRRKLDGTGLRIRTLRGTGYAIERLAKGGQRYRGEA